jgi:thiol-disulfide isomerase/thioredoxin
MSQIARHRPQHPPENWSKRIIKLLIPRLVVALAICMPLWSVAAPVAVGDIAPAIDLPTLPDTSKQLTLESLRGKVVYVDFWASWCGPCRVSFPLLEDIRAQLAPRGFEVLAVNVDEFEDDALEFLQQVPVSYQVVRDASGTSPKTYGILGMPTGFLVDRQGVIRMVHQGFRKSDGPRLKAAIVELLGQ